MGRLARVALTIWTSSAISKSYIPEDEIGPVLEA